MARLCERPGCSEPGAAAYGMVPEDLLFWIAPLHGVPVDDHNVLCRRHADAMVVPRGWTLDDRREPVPRLFMPRRPEADEPAARPGRRRRRTTSSAHGIEQLVIDGTGEIGRPAVDDARDEATAATPGGVAEVAAEPAGNEPWQPDFDADDDLDGLLEVQSPLLARAFRGTDRRKR